MSGVGGQPAALPSRRLEVITAGLSGASRRVVRRGAGFWSGSLRKGKPKRYTARLDGDWLLLELSMPRSRDDETAVSGKAWMLLKVCEDLPAGVKVVRHARGGTFHLRAELLLAREEQDEQELSRRIRAACHQIQEAVEQCRMAEAAGGGARLFFLEPQAANEAAVDVDMEAICRATSWPVVQGGVEPAVHLQTTHGVYRARVGMPGNGKLQATVEVVRTASLSEICRRSLGLFLLGVGSGVKGARATAREEGEVTVLRLEALVGVEAIDLNRGLGALRMACEVCGREVKLLADEQVAEAYLAYAGTV